MGKLLVKERSIVVPGQEIAQGMDFLPSNGTYREKDKIVAFQLGLISVYKSLVKVIPLSGRYIPKVNDIVIGKVTEMGFYGWSVDIRCPYIATLSIRDATEFIDRDDDLSKYYDFNDLIIAKISKIKRHKSIDLTTKGPGLRKISSGKIIEVTPSKVPRMIGKQGSMISLIKEKTGCNIVIGQNGRVWIQGTTTDKEVLATKAIIKIEQESHISGLTDKIKEFLEKGGKK